MVFLTYKARVLGAVGTVFRHNIQSHKTSVRQLRGLRGIRHLDYQLERLLKIPESPNRTPTEASGLLRFQFVQRLAGRSLKEINLSLTFETGSVGFESGSKGKWQFDPVHWSEMFAPFSLEQIREHEV